MSAELAVFELPFAVPPVQVDMVWHQRTRLMVAQQWLREGLSAASEAAFSISVASSPDTTNAAKKRVRKTKK